MQANEAPRSPKGCCHNCGLPCKGMFCCDWCFDTYLARRDAHRVAHRRKAQAQPDKGSETAAN